MKEYYRVQANINLDAIRLNVKKAKELVKPGTKIMGIIKADGYGHGAVPIAKVLKDDVDAYGIAIIEEGIELRRSGVKKPILILGYTPEPMIKDLVEYDIMPAIFSYETAKKISDEACRQNKTVKAHIKLDTGMSRIGFSLTEESLKTIIEISKLEGMQIEGCFSHFSKADEKDKRFTYIQLKRFEEFTKKIEEAGIKIATKHISNSAGIIEFPEANYDMVRIGISTYGLYPSEDVDKEKHVLEPAMEIKTCVSFLKEMEEGIGIGYGGTFVTSRKTKVATVPVGYGDGYPRGLSGKGRVLIHGKSAPILGRVCMDQFMVDVTDIDDIAVGDEVTLVGRDKEEFISVEELANMTGSFNYEFVCDVGKRIPRVYYYDGKKVGTSDFYSFCQADFEWE